MWIQIMKYFLVAKKSQWVFGTFHYFLVPIYNFNKGFVVNHCNDFRGSKYEVQKFHFSSKNCSWEKSLKGRVFSFSKSNMKVCFVCVCVPWWIYIQTKKLVGVKSKLMTLSNNSWRVFWANRPISVKSHCE